MELTIAFFQVINYTTWILLFIFGMHYYVVTFMFLKRKKTLKQNADKNLELKDFPLIAVQLPIFNELFVVERLLDNISKLDWPKDKLEIQLLDDSNDETVELAAKKVKELKASGINIQHIRRPERTEFKAGALKYGLTLTKAKYIAIFDADFLPEPDFLKKTIPHLLNEEKAAFVQARWGHINRSYSPFTYAQSLGIDGHFVVEQSSRNLNKLWMNFNGTAGVWRKKAIYEAGNWTGDTLTEDLDLSYRAQLKGWTCVYLPHVECPAEVPIQVLPYKNQQFRWAKGSIQSAKKLIPSIIKAKAPFKSKLESMIHLSYYSVHCLMFLNIASLLPMLLFKQHIEVKHFIPAFAAASLSMLAPITLALVSQLHLKNGFFRTLKYIPFMFFMGLGITIHITIAFFQGLFSKNKGIFVRTPKLGLDGNKSNKEIYKKKKYKSKINMVIILEFIFIAVCFLEVYLIVKHFSPIFLFFPLLMGISVLYMSSKTIKDKITFGA